MEGCAEPIWRQRESQGEGRRLRFRSSACPSPPHCRLCQKLRSPSCRQLAAPAPPEFSHLFSHLPVWKGAAGGLRSSVGFFSVLGLGEERGGGHPPWAPSPTPAAHPSQVCGSQPEEGAGSVCVSQRRALQAA